MQTFGMYKSRVGIILYAAENHAWPRDRCGIFNCYEERNGILKSVARLGTGGQFNATKVKLYGAPLNYRPIEIAP